MSVYKYRSGLIFDDKMDSAHPRWAFSPSQSVQYTADGLKMDHSENETMALFDLPLDKNLLMLEVTADYIPTAPSDEGGIVIYQNDNNRLDFLESLDTVTVGEYSSWRAVKKGGYWTFFAKRNGSWELFDTSPLNAVKAGVTLQGSTSNGFAGQFVPLTMKRVVLCEGNALTVANLPDYCRVELFDEAGTHITHGSVAPGYMGVELQLPSLPFRGYVQVFDSTDTLLSQSDVAEFYGGDVYLYGADLEIHWKGQELSTVDFTDVGPMVSGVIEEQMEVVNPTPLPVANIRLSLEQYKLLFGYEWVDIAPDAGGTPGTYADIVDIGLLAAGERRPFWIKVTKMDDRFLFEPAYFTVDIIHT